MLNFISATATLRNRWLKSKGYFITEEEKQTKEKKRRDDYKRAMERLKKEYGGKTLSSADPVPKPRRADTTIWEGEVKKRFAHGFSCVKMGLVSTYFCS